MNKLALPALLLALGGGLGYWFGQQQASPVAASSKEAATPARKLLYYRNPMGLPDTSPTPKKDSMGMDYIPVYEGEEPAAAGAEQLAISSEKIQKLGVRTEAVSKATLARVIRAAGRVEVDERRVHVIAPKFEGYIERLHVNASGQAVGKGQALFEVYAPELVSAQREYAIARHGVEGMKAADGEAQAGMRQLAEAALSRLRNWDISEAQLKALAKSGEIQRTLTFRSPANGIVTEKKAVQGMRFMPGDSLYQISDLSSVWVIADIAERDVALVKAGSKVAVSIDAYPGRTFAGSVSYVYPTLSSETRTVPVRIELANPQQLLKPGMYAQVALQFAGHAAQLSVPDSAVIDSGLRQMVLVQLGEGRFEARQVKLGERNDERVAVLEGLSEGERVVIAANFLLDAESNLKAAIAGLGSSAAADQAGGKATGKATAKAASVGHQAHGKLVELDAAAGTAMITHEPVASLKWPGMTMEFKFANPALAAQLKPGAEFDFEFVERAPGEWVITAVKSAAHAGH